MIIRFELPNGIRVIHKQTASPVVFCGLTVEAGTRDEEANEHGIAHFLEHTLFKGTKKRRAYHINNRLDSAGGELNAFTTKEETVIQACVTADDFPKAIELIADITFNSVFPKNEINKEKQVVCEEIDSYDDCPSELIFDDFEDLLFSGSSIGRNILGTKKSVKSYTPEDVKRFVLRTYNTDRMVFSSTGKISERRLKYYCEKYFGTILSNPRQFSRIEPNEYKIFDTKKRKKTHQAHVILGNRGYNRYDDRRTALTLLLNYLGGPASNSMLNMLLREKHGLVYTVETNCTMYDDTGNVTIYYASSETNMEKTHDRIRSELAKAGKTPLSKYQLAKAKKQLVGQYLIAQENNEHLMQTMGKNILNYNCYEGHETVVRQIEAVTATDLADIANEIFMPDMISRLAYIT
ncbi:MAG: insulinase family protein [Prevotellaceae bacterium]|jgi:predicted Zn-dependent peptidase|nr:insulinase family protein [Prevotellaceae bacterium]